jgi:glycosyltransferase involved in cell wall biosynthesis
VRIAFDGRALSFPAGGVRRYVTQLFAALARRADTHVIAVGVADRAAVPPGIEVQSAAWSLPTNLGWALTGLPIAVARAGADLVHAPAYTAPLWGARPLVVTVHDVSYARHPEWYPHRLDPVRRWFHRASAERADRIITDSSFSRAEIAAAYGIDTDRIDVIPLGVEAAFSPDPATIRERFVLHVGDLHARRNLGMLFDVVLELRRTEPGCRDLRLVLAGRDFGELAGLRARAAASGAPDALDYVGCPDDAALLALYRTAHVFAYPSRYEGFGLPLLEAMACGAPVVAAAASAVPEVCGDAALLVPPDDRRGWAEALRAVLLDPALASSLVAAGPVRAAPFSWDRCAERTRATYEHASSARHNPG